MYYCSAEYPFYSRAVLFAEAADPAGALRKRGAKLELIGTLAASTAHEIRNPLTGISGFIQLLQKKYKGEEDQLYFSIIEQEIKRINQIVSEFLVLGKPTAENGS